MVCVVALTYTGIAVWITPESRPPAPTTTANQPPPSVLPSGTPKGRGQPSGKSGTPKSPRVGPSTSAHTNTIPPEIIEKWKKEAPRRWRKNPLHQSILGFQQTFEAGVCDGGIPDLTREVPGPWQNWGLQDVSYGCVSNQYASPGTLDFPAKIFSYASTHTIIPSNFTSGYMAVSIGWYSGRQDGSAKWQVVMCYGGIRQPRFSFSSSRKRYRRADQGSCSNVFAES